MGLHPDTIQILDVHQAKFSEELNQSIGKILTLIRETSPMSDTNFLLHKFDYQVPGIIVPQQNVSWLPIRNLARILGYIASLEFTTMITAVEIKSMSCGCDYFDGELQIATSAGTTGGYYKWQWTAFPGGERSYKQFTDFPNINKLVIVK